LKVIKSKHSNPKCRFYKLYYVIIFQAFENDEAIVLDKFLFHDFNGNHWREELFHHNKLGTRCLYNSKGNIENVVNAIYKERTLSSLQSGLRTEPVPKTIKTNLADLFKAE